MSLQVARPNFFPLFLIVFLLSVNTACAQSERLELGRRLKRFEIAWESATPNARAACVQPLQAAVGNFFGLKLNEAARQLDQAWFAVRGVDSISAIERSAIGLQLTPQPILSDTQVDKLSVKLTPLYPTNERPADQVIVRLALRDSAGAMLAQTEIGSDLLRSGFDWSVGLLPEGDHRLQTEFLLQDQTYELPSITVTRVSQLESRLLQLEAQAKSLRANAEEDLVRSVATTVRHELRLLRNVYEGQTQEADFPLLARLRFVEKIASSPANLPSILVEYAGKSDLWISLVNDTRSVKVRIRIPNYQQELAPVLIVFHGAGGSENMFFETYGAGRVIREAEKRGWLVVSPGYGPLGLSLDIGDMLDALQLMFPIDRNRVMLLGHSMGAAQVVQQVQDHPTIALGAVALGGGRKFSIPNGKVEPKTSWFVAAGQKDFGLTGARQLHQSLLSLKLPSIFLEYPDVEHLVVVQAAIEDSFLFLDDLKSSNR